MANLLDLINQGAGGFANLLNNLGQAPMAGGANGQVPQVDPALAAMAGPGALAAAQANYQRNLQAGMQDVAAHGGSLGMMMNAPGVGAGNQYSAEVRQAAQDAMQLRALRRAQDAMGGMNGDPFSQMNAGAAVSMVNPQAGAAIQNAAKSQIGDAQLAYHSAQQAQRAGHSDAAASYYIQFLKATGRLNISERTGAMTLLGGINPGDLKYISIDPSSHTITGAAGQGVLPGGAGVEQRLAAARSVGSAQGDLVQLIDPNTHRAYFVPKGSLLPGGAGQSAPSPGTAPPGPTTPGAQPGAQPPAAQNRPIAALAPEQQAYETNAGKETSDYLTKMQEQADNARDTNYSIDQMLRASQGALVTPGANVRAVFEKALSGVGGQFGIGASNELTNYQEMEKYSNKIAFAAARQMGAKEAAQVVQMQLESNPNRSMTADAFNGVSNAMKAMNNYVIDKNAALQTEGQNARSAAAKWTQNVDPRVWALTLSPQMGAQWAKELGPKAIQRAYQYMTPEERSSLIANIPADVRAQWVSK